MHRYFIFSCILSGLRSVRKMACRTRPVRRRAEGLSQGGAAGRGVPGTERADTERRQRVPLRRRLVLLLDPLDAVRGPGQGGRADGEKVPRVPDQGQHLLCLPHDPEVRKVAVFMC